MLLYSPVDIVIGKLSIAEEEIIVKGETGWENTSLNLENLRKDLERLCLISKKAYADFDGTDTTKPQIGTALKTCILNLERVYCGLTKERATVGYANQTAEGTKYYQSPFESFVILCLELSGAVFVENNKDNQPLKKYNDDY